MNPNVDERIRAALSAAADEIHESDLRAERPPDATAAGGAARRARWLAPVLAAAAVVAVAVGTAAIISTHTASKVQPGHPVNPTPPLVTSAPATPAPSNRSSGATRRALPPPTSAVSGTHLVNCYFADAFGCPVPRDYVFYQPLWPFGSYAQAKAWQAASTSSGAQPWHLYAGQTALLFTQNYLGFKDITTVTSTKIDGDEAHIGVGYRLPNGQLHTAAVLHLVRYTPTRGDVNAGWEVVGSDDTDFSLERPAYGSTVTSPMTVGGHITGVDENITVVVLPQPSNNSSGAGLALPAGGANAPWQLSVPFTQRGVLTIVASTGGHLTQHERFAIQGVHT